jgi:hypothetical protein
MRKHADKNKHMMRERERERGLKIMLIHNAFIGKGYVQIVLLYIYV